MTGACTRNSWNDILPNIPWVCYYMQSIIVMVCVLSQQQGLIVSLITAHTAVGMLPHASSHLRPQVRVILLGKQMCIQWKWHGRQVGFVESILPRKTSTATFPAGSIAGVPHQRLTNQNGSVLIAAAPLYVRQYEEQCCTNTRPYFY
jgi:hypothetical protein